MSRAFIAGVGVGAWALPLGMWLGRVLGRRNDRANDYVFGVR